MLNEPSFRLKILSAHLKRRHLFRDVRGDIPSVTPKSWVAGQSKCTIAQVNAPVFQCEGVVGLWLPDLKVCCIAFEVIRDRNWRFLREFLCGTS